MPALSISSSTSLNPDEMPRRTFPLVRKGVDGEAVRRYLETIADDVRALLERETQLRRRIAEAERKAAEPPVLDEATLNRAVGVETARVLQSAHDAAREVVARAEGRAAELLATAEAQVAARSAAAEEESTRLVAAATERAAGTAAGAEADATALRAGAEAEGEAIIEAAREDAVALLDTTKQRCRQTVRDARQLRNSVLSDLVERRRALFVQLEQLRSGRDSLVDVVATVEATVEELKARLAEAEHGARIAAAEAGDRAETLLDDEDETLLEPDDDLEEHAALLGEDLETEEEELASGTGSGVAADDEEAVVDLDEEALIDEEDQQDHEVQARDTAASHRSVGELFARIRAARGSDGILAGEATSAIPATEGPEADSATEAGPPPEADSAVEAGPSSEADSAAEAMPATEAVPAIDVKDLAGVSEAGTAAGEPATAETEVVTSPGAAAEAGATEPESAATTPQPPQGPAVGPEPVTAQPSGEPAAEAAEASGEAAEASGEAAGDGLSGDPDAVARARRNELLAPVVVKLSRALKRALQDDQNELLNALRHASGAPELDVLLPEEAQSERYTRAAAEALGVGWLLGRSWLRPESESDGGLGDAEAGAEATETGKQLALELAREVSGLLRHRLAESLHALGEVGEGAQDAVGAAYREWKGPRVEGIAGDFATRAFATGAVAAAEGTIVRWVVDDGKPCPDCDDNALAGEQRAGDAWPTGQLYPPVHPGCRCLLVATTD
jgi:hypothetical protein